MFTNKKLKSQILIYFLIYDKEKYNLAMSKSADILSKLIANQYQPIIKGKIPEEA